MTPLPHLKEGGFQPKGCGPARTGPFQGGKNLPQDREAIPPPAEAGGPLARRLMADVVRAALVQATWTGDTESMIAKHEEHAREAARQGAKVIGFQEVFNAPYFCQVQEPEHYRWAEPVPDGPTVRTDAGAGPRDRHGDRRPGLRGRAVRLLLQHRGRDRRRRHLPRQVPQAPHPAGQGLLGEVLLQAGQPRLARLRHRRRQGRRLHLLRPPLPGGLARSSAWTAPSSSTTRPPPRAACPPTCGSWSSPRPPSPTSTSSPRSTASARRSTATTTSTARATSSTRAASSSARSPATRRRNSSYATSTST